ncbi:retinol dehydrogenase 11-like [Maniola jurtina]|uniref:retinol dehydrogenase 11-like n=1 Tax=Maniola jurtina TaxID=191418 RepID=UPI001E68788E|nr:retinol dehydrogenase 11-like [Maniola jurtina]
MSYIYLLIFTLIVLSVYARSTSTIEMLCKSTKRLDGNTVIVTGGTAGMGLEIATDFAKRGARVIIACPFEKEGLEGCEYIKKLANKEAIFKLLDLSSIQSVRKFAGEIIESEEKLHILVNNAGVYMADEFITDDGLNSVMQINYFGPFLLTLLLIPLLKKTGRISEPSRIVNVTSQAHFKGKIDFRKMGDIKYCSSFQIYANSKLCLTLFTRELTKKLKRSNVVVNNADPGYVATFIVKFENRFLKFMYYLLIQVLRISGFKSPLVGAQTAIHVALDDDVGAVSGETFYNCKLSKAAVMTYDEDLAQKLWDESIKLVKLEREELFEV